MGLIFCCVRFSFFSLCFPMEKNRSNSFSISPGSIVPPPVFFLPVPAPFLHVPALFLPAALFCSFCAALALYSSLFCLSLRIRYASPISLNRSSAALSPGSSPDGFLSLNAGSSCGSHLFLRLRTLPMFHSKSSYK